MKKATIALLLICTAAFAQQKGSFTDTRDKKTYKTVKIGKQTWMAENLNYAVEGSKCYGEGGGYSENEFGEEVKITYPNSQVQANCKKYGRLYNEQGAKEACPSGWHLPSDKEWQILVDFAGGEKAAGKKLKAKSGWDKKTNGTDNYGFSALPGGFYALTNFVSISSKAYFGGTSENNGSGISLPEMDGINIIDVSPESGLLSSIRCIQDQTEP